MTSLVEPASALRALIPVYRPDLSGNEQRYVLDCLETNWISSLGVYIPRFEHAVAEITGAAHAIAVSNGTVALHLALHSLGIGPGDEVIVPTFTYIASVNAIRQTGATPVFADSQASDWQLDPVDVLRRITPRTKAIVAVHLYGAACNMTALVALARRHGLRLIEDCAEAFGTKWQGRHVGTIGDVGTFSFFGNKTVTTGEGGMVICNDDALAEEMRLVKGQGQSPHKRYWHDRLGFNYRMTNICAAIGLAQIERLPSTLERKAEIAAQYCERLADIPVTLQLLPREVDASLWLLTLLLPQCIDRDRLMERMWADAIETRPVFFCAHTMPVYSGLNGDERFPVAEDIAARGISLPSFPSLSSAEIDHVVQSLSFSLEEQTEFHDRR
jgi:perosamine synthetase